MSWQALKYVLEALLMSSDKPLSLSELQSAFETSEMPSCDELAIALDKLADDYRDRAIELTETASGYRLQTRKHYSPWIARLNAEKPIKYSKALLETLAIIAYKQPVTRADIEDIRGVAVSSGIIRTLLERDWIKVAGHRDVPGRPSVYVTSQSFLDYFNLKAIEQLPSLHTEEEL